MKPIPLFELTQLTLINAFPCAIKEMSYSSKRTWREKPGQNKMTDYSFYVSINEFFASDKLYGE